MALGFRRIWGRVTVVPLVLALGGCASQMSALCGDGAGGAKVWAMALAGCSLTPTAPVPKTAVPNSFRNETVEWQLEPTATGKSTDATNPARAIGASPVMGSSARKLDGAASPPQAGKAQVDALFETVAQVIEPEPSVDLRPPSEWWRLFGSAELDSLVELALANNHDLKAAAARVLQAQATAGIAAGALLPTIDLNGRGQSTRPNGGVGNRVRLPDGNSQRLYQVGVVASYELDFWGKNRAAMESALASAQASNYERQTVATTLLSEVTTAYFQYLALSDRLGVAMANVQNVTDVLATVTTRFEIGEGSEIEVQQQSTALAQAKAVVPVLTLSREQVRLRLTTLTGSLPEQLSLRGGAIVDLAIPVPPAMLPSSLLANRPDLRRAEEELLAANADIGVARGRLLPSFTLSAETGYGANYISQIFTPVGWYSILAGSLGGVLFDNGKSLSEIELRKAVYGERAEAYRQAVLNALRDVEDALAQIRLDAQVEAAQRIALERAARAYQLAQMGLQIGTSDYLTILETERTRYQLEDAVVQSRLDRLNAAVSLFRSLGGSTEQPTS